MKRHCFYSMFSGRPALVTIAFLVWSMIMFAIGDMTGSAITQNAERVFGISQSQASPLRQSATRIIRLDRERLARRVLAL